jgi:[protein-PII] uridylyltransferase
MSLSTDYFLQHSVDAIVWHTELLWPPGRRIDRMKVEMRNDALNRCTELFIYGPDRDDLFAHSTALLDQLGLNVLSARIQATQQGLSINSYLVLEDDGSQIEAEERLLGIRHYLEDGLNSAEPPQGRPRMPRRLKPFQMPSEVSFEQDETRVVTLLTLKTSDRPGLLSLVGQAFAANKLRLHNARIATAGAEAQDTFAITDRQDQPITEPAQLARIADSICQMLDD